MILWFRKRPIVALQWLTTIVGMKGVVPKELIEFHRLGTTLLG